MDTNVKERAIKSGKIKGLVEENKNTWITAVRFTDTPENLARFVAAAGDSLFVKEPLRLEKVEGGKKP